MILGLKTCIWISVFFTNFLLNYKIYHFKNAHIARSSIHIQYNCGLHCKENCSWDQIEIVGSSQANISSSLDNIGKESSTQGKYMVGED